MARPPRPICPNEACVNHHSPPADFYRKNGWFKRQHDNRKVPRYQCLACGKSFCSTQTQINVHQHRPDLNRKIFGLAVSGATMRRIADLTGCHKDTVQAKIIHLANQARAYHAEFLRKLAEPVKDSSGNVIRQGTAFVMMDELETFIHARYRKVSVPVVVRVKTGQVLAFGVARVPSSMPLGGAGSGPIPPGGSSWTHNDRSKVVPAVLATIAPVLNPAGATISTDGESSYPKWIRAQLPGVQHVVRHSPKESVLGRAKRRADGTARETDPLFAINLTHAKMRNDLARLGRKTWTTTKTIAGLENHLWLWVAWTNGYQVK